jgi:hypothetical protein
VLPSGTFAELYKAVREQGLVGAFTTSQRSCQVFFTVIGWLVVEPYPSEKYEFVTWDDDIPNIWKVIKFMFQTDSKPPTSWD